MSDKKIDFEASLKELEKIVARLEEGDCSLEESISLFEKGMECTRLCKTALETAEKRIFELTSDKGE